MAHSTRSVLVLIRRTQIRSLIIKMGDFCDHRIVLGDPNPCERTTQILSATAQTSITNKKRSIFGTIALYEGRKERAFKTNIPRHHRNQKQPFSTAF